MLYGNRKKNAIPLFPFHSFYSHTITSHEYFTSKKITGRAIYMRKLKESIQKSNRVLYRISSCQY